MLTSVHFHDKTAHFLWCLEPIKHDGKEWLAGFLFCLLARWKYQTCEMKSRSVLCFEIHLKWAKMWQVHHSGISLHVVFVKISSSTQNSLSYFSGIYCFIWSANEATQMPRSIKILFNSNRKEDVDFMSVLAKITSLLNIFVCVYVSV